MPDGGLLGPEAEVWQVANSKVLLPGFAPDTTRYRVEDKGDASLLAWAGQTEGEAGGLHEGSMTSMDLSASRRRPGKSPDWLPLKSEP